MDVTGEEIAATAGEEATLMGGANVRSEQRGGSKFFYADRDGRVNLKNHVLSVRALAAIERDVDGKLETEEGKDVHIRGSVRSGSTIVAGGSLIIDGMVEAGAQIHAQDDVLVARGIIGHDTQIVAKGNVTAEFVQSAAVVAWGDVTIADHTMNAQVRAGGKLTTTAPQVSSAAAARLVAN